MIPITKRQTHDFIIDVLNQNLLKHKNFKQLFCEFFKVYVTTIKHYTSIKMHPFPPEFYVQQMIKYDEKYESVNTYVSNTYNYNSPSINYSRQDSYDEIEPFLFFNRHCYNEFLTKENMRLYLPFAISNTVKHIAHLKNITYSLYEFMQTEQYTREGLFLFHEKMTHEGLFLFHEKMTDVHDFIAEKLKTVGMEPRKFTNYSLENAHNYLSEFPPYVEHTKQYFKTRKMEFVFVCDEIYKSYDAEIVGNRVAVDELIMMCIVKFL